MKIAVGTDDGKRVRKGHFCKSGYFVVIEILNAEVMNRVIRVNPYAETQEVREQDEKTYRILHLLADCSLFMGKIFEEDAVDKIVARGVDCITTNFEQIDDAVCSYLDGKLAGFRYYSPDMKEHLPCSDRPYS
jgi:predicted Fe-Mo cluster-binding NifX family protein